MNLNPNLKDFWFTPKNKIIKSRYKVLYGGRSSSKSHDIARMLIFLSINMKKRILCLRMFQVRLSDSVYSLLQDIIYQSHLDGYFKFTKSSIICTVTGSEFLFYGIARNTSQLKGLEAIDIAFIEEAETLTKEAFDIITPTIRAENSEIIIAFNPQLDTDFVYDYFIVNTPKNARIRHINYTENPYLSNTMLNDIEIFKAQDYEAFKHLFLGYPKTDDVESVIQKSTLLACIGAKKKLKKRGFSFNNSKRVIGYDVADMGGDTNAYCVLDGIEIVDIVEWKGEENGLMESSRKVHSRAKKDNCEVVYDSVGVGAGVGSNFKILNSQDPHHAIKFTKFVAGGAVFKPNSFYRIGAVTTEIKNKDYFENIKAQAWITLRDRLKATERALNGSIVEKEEDLISISKDISLLNKLIKELTTPHLIRSENQKNAIEKKKDMIKRGVKSPNLADALVMTILGTKAKWSI